MQIPLKPGFFLYFPAESPPQDKKRPHRLGASFLCIYLRRGVKRRTARVHVTSSKLPTLPILYILYTNSPVNTMQNNNISTNSRILPFQSYPFWAVFCSFFLPRSCIFRDMFNFAAPEGYTRRYQRSACCGMSAKCRIPQKRE